MVDLHGNQGRNRRARNVPLWLKPGGFKKTGRPCSAWWETFEGASIAFEGAAQGDHHIESVDEAMLTCGWSGKIRENYPEQLEKA